MVDVSISYDPVGKRMSNDEIRLTNRNCGILGHSTFVIRISSFPYVFFALGFARDFAALVFDCSAGISGA